MVALLVEQGQAVSSPTTLPLDWPLKPLGQLISALEAGVSVNSTSDPALAAEDGAAVLKTSCIKGGKFLPHEAKTILARDRDRARVSPRAGSIIVSRMNTIDLVGECGLVDADYPHLFLPDRLWLTRHQGPVLHSVAWLAWMLNTPKARELLRGRATGTSGSMKNLSKSGFLSVEIPVPNEVAEQEAIAQALADADALIESLEQLIEKKRQIKQGAMQELLTAKRRLPGFEGVWVERILGNWATLKARIGWQGLTAGEYLSAGDYWLVTGTDFLDGFVDWSGCCFVDKIRYDQDSNIQLQGGDLLVTKDGTIGKVAIVANLPGPATLNSGVFVIRPKMGAFDPIFFYYVLQSRAFKEFLAQLSAGSTINHLYQKDFVNFSFLAPNSLDEQQEIGQMVYDVESDIRGLEARLEKVKQIKEGMMQELLTGRIRLI